MNLVVATHGHCFDGLASAVVFTRLLRAAEGPQVKAVYRGCGYGEGQLVPSDALFTGDQNAILDYRFVPSDRLTWYFDHHRTAFVTPADRELFESRRATGKYFFDADMTSCTKLVAGIAEKNFGVDVSDLGEMIRWADVIDSAAFDTPEQALDRSNPVLRLAAVVERHGDDAFLARVVPELIQKPLAEVAAGPEVAKRYEKLGAQHERFVRRVRERAVRMGRVVFVDLTDEPLETIGKFVTYALYPDAVYSVIVGKLKNAAKISVGYNPWSGKPCDFDISAICARHGGGGHRVVGAVQRKASELAETREIALSIARELAG
ncbi:MAG TPA: hypothetical protein VHE30_16875 [Polyangiaceae bacterium]|nr:hypothetical protein [Polyangiaceae bacterium]